MVLFCFHVSVISAQYLRIHTPGGRDCREQSDRYETAESNCASVGIAAETFTDEILSVASSTLHFMKLFKKKSMFMACTLSDFVVS